MTSFYLDYFWLLFPKLLMRLTLKSAQLICALTLTRRQYTVAELLFRETMRHLSAECCCGGWSCGSLLPHWSLHYHNLPRPQISRHHNLKHFISTIDCVIIPINRTLQDWLLAMNVIVVVSCDSVLWQCGTLRCYNDVVIGVACHSTAGQCTAKWEATADSQ